jgi:hypothetical protein
MQGVFFLTPASADLESATSAAPRSVFPQDLTLLRNPDIGHRRKVEAIRLLGGRIREGEPREGSCTQVPKKLSLTAVSWQSPARLMLHSLPLSASIARQEPRACRPPRSEWWIHLAAGCLPSALRSEHSPRGAQRTGPCVRAAPIVRPPWTSARVVSRNPRKLSASGPILRFRGSRSPSCGTFLRRNTARCATPYAYATVPPGPARPEIPDSLGSAPPRGCIRTA